MIVLRAPRVTGIPLSLKILRGCGAVLLILAPLRLLIPLSEGAEKASTTRTSPLVSDHSSKSAAPTPAMIAKFRTNCIKCHDVDGRGEIGRDEMPTIPDFTNPTWQASRNDPQLRHSISEGKGKSMPSWKRKLAPADIERMVALVRRFTGGQLVVPEEETEDPGSHPAPPDDVPRANASPGPSSRPGQEAVAGLQVGEIFRRSCQICHGADGRGTPSRSRLPGIPDFTSGRWHEGRSQAQLAASILEGKGQMPSFRSKLGAEEVHALASYVRAFGPLQDPPQNTPSGDFDRRLDHLQREFEELRRAYQELSPRPSDK